MQFVLSYWHSLIGVHFMRITAIISLVVVSLPACTPPVSSISAETREVLTLCGGGYKDIIGADLEAKIGKSLEAGGNINAELRSEVRAAFLGSDGVSGPDQQKSFEDYIGCIERLT